ncbi:MAG: GFA family protein [Pseudomonadota bacterium]
MSWINAYRKTGRLDGRCLCGQVRITVDGKHIAAIGVCHCRMCQRWAGYTYGTFEAEADAVSVQGEVTVYASSDFSSRAFCPSCGSSLWMRNGDDGAYELMPGLFPDAADFPLVSEIYTDCRPAYVPLAGRHRSKTRAEYEAGAQHIEGDDP